MTAPATTDQFRAWMTERDAHYAAANAAGATETQASNATDGLVARENELIQTPAETLAGNYFRCLAVVKLSADGHSIDDDAAPAIEAEADAFRAEQLALQAAFDEALAEYRRVRAISDAMPLGAEGEDAAVDAFCIAMDHLIEEVRTPNLAAVVVKINLAEARAEGFCGWFEDHRKAIMEDLDYLAATAFAA
ncbi:hypothetical protein HRJ34_00040 [Rhizorhabdus wittichii]|uniref:Uncharacterized protein n=1 Tax=Rhizorhabdus wittichii TaxID=160791 RepID=A0A975D3I5_9SPHN|nr:hypothetical protein [Rhizorhabdus wittichii]QTH21968.1 hypothetical protein HRJ34_00040 [Rhizorhabdus wittichii]